MIKISRMHRELFDAFSKTADGKYVFLNILDFDLSLWSEDAVEYFGLPATEMQNAGAIWSEHIDPSQREAYIANITDLFEGRIDSHDLTYRARNRHGIYVTCSCKGKVIRDSSGKPRYFVGTIVNHEGEDSFDPVTGLYSFQHLFGTMRQFAKERRPFYLLLAGVRSFHQINEAYGYQMGNQILKRLGDLALREGKLGMIFRLEGTKIAFCYDAALYSEHEIREGFERIRAQCASLDLGGTVLHLDLRGILVLCSDFSIDTSTYYNSALTALAEAKSQYESRLDLFNPAAIDEQRRHLEILSVIRQSVLEGCRGFFLVFQPIMSAADESVTGMEALLRWRSPELGVVPPNCFIPWLETDPIFFELGNWIIREAILACQEVHKLLPGFTVNVNLAYPQLQRSDFNQHLKRILRETGFPPGQLKLELTERCKLMSMSKLRDEMVFFKSEGFMTSLDDFGTGYSALNLLVDLPIDQIKIDKSFIDGIMSDVPRQALLEAITHCARKLGVGLCIEGIENCETKDYLKENFYVTGFQGYYYSKPLELPDLLGWLKARARPKAPGEAR
ncbi:MAG: EAL domain-containing protein [Succinivibrionaceae bacterium]|nr:EAL domain-containing protein [Succinivibrionaceae bacterium]